MCEAVEYWYNGVRVIATADAHGSRLPVRLRSGAMLMIPWGAQGRTFHGTHRETQVVWPDGCHVALTTIKHGAWADLAPRPVRLPITRFFVFRRLDAVTLDHWVTLRPGETLQGALIACGADRAAYVVTVDPPAELQVLSPWPRIVSEKRGNSERA
jgi:hypothetical protein